MKTLRIFLFEWDQKAALKTIHLLEQRGYSVEVESENGARGCKSVITHKPDALIFDLTQKPSHSSETAEVIRWRKDCKNIPMIFLNGTTSVREKTKKRVGDALFINSEKLLETLESLAVLPELSNEPHTKTTRETVEPQFS